MSVALDRRPQLGSKPVSLTVKVPPPKQTEDAMATGLREMYQRGDFVDVTLSCADQSHAAHRVVLASRSPIFRSLLDAQGPPAPGTRQEVRIAEISNPEAVKFMLDFIYEAQVSDWAAYNPSTQEITKDVLRLAQQFQVKGLTESATVWLAKDINTGNVVERLAICDDFGLGELREKILNQLHMNKTALIEVATSPQIIEYPELMKDLILLQASGMQDEPQAKKARKA